VGKPHRQRLPHPSDAQSLPFRRRHPLQGDHAAGIDADPAKASPGRSDTVLRRDFRGLRHLLSLAGLGAPDQHVTPKRTDLGNLFRHRRRVSAPRTARPAMTERGTAAPQQPIHHPTPFQGIHLALKPGMRFALRVRAGPSWTGRSVGLNSTGPNRRGRGRGAPAREGAGPGPAVRPSPAPPAIH
jgi:hypothetical protein